MRAHDARVFKIEQKILKLIEPMHRGFLGLTKRIIDEELGPVDRRAARQLLEHIRVGDLP